MVQACPGGAHVQRGLKESEVEHPRNRQFHKFGFFRENHELSNMIIPPWYDRIA